MSKTCLRKRIKNYILSEYMYRIKISSQFMKLTKTLTVLGLLFICLTANAQVDAIKIASAKKAIENKDYEIALQTLSDVSSVGRKNKMYLFYEGEAFYNLFEYDSAEVYYKKYFILDINNSDVAEKLADIDYKRKKGFRQIAIEMLISQLNNLNYENDGFNYNYNVTNSEIIINVNVKKYNNKLLLTQTVFFNDIKKIVKYQSARGIQIFTDDKKVIQTDSEGEVDYKFHLFNLPLYNSNVDVINRIYVTLNSIIANK